jgi:hypothetical protein
MYTSIYTCRTINNPTLVLIGVQNPRYGQLLHIVKADGSLGLLPDTLQGRQQDSH